MEVASNHQHPQANTIMPVHPVAALDENADNRRDIAQRHGSYEHVMEQTVDRRQIAVGGEPTGVTSHKGDVRKDQTVTDGMRPMMIPISGERKSKISVSIHINSGGKEESTTARDQALEEAREQLRMELDPENLTRGPPSPSKIPPKFLGSGFSSLQDIEAGTCGDAVIHGDPRCRPGTSVKLAPGYENNPEWPQLRKHAGKQGVLVREVSGGWGWIAKFGDGEETFRTRDGIYMLCYLVRPDISLSLSLSLSLFLSYIHTHTHTHAQTACDWPG